MGTAAHTCRTWTRGFHACIGRMRPLALPVQTAVSTAVSTARAHPDIRAFQQGAFHAKQPLLFRSQSGSPASQLLCLGKWFIKDARTGRGLSDYMIGYGGLEFPYELSLSSPEKRNAATGFLAWLQECSNPASALFASFLQTPNEDQTFFQFASPLRLLIDALEFNRAQRSMGLSTLDVYIAQASLEELPYDLKDDVSTPELVRRAGYGDIYQSSLWLGAEPTYTPLHRDPNPNLFCQLCGGKLVRLLPPSAGDRLFASVQAKIGHNANSRIRTTEMMQGKEHQVLHQAVWDNDEAGEFYEAELGPGDALFIPNGWWHSVKSQGAGGELNGSVNWWFR